MFFANDPYHIDETVDYKGDGMESQFLANGLVHCKEDGLEQDFSYDVKNYA